MIIEFGSLETRQWIDWWTAHEDSISLSELFIINQPTQHFLYGAVSSKGIIQSESAQLVRNELNTGCVFTTGLSCGRQPPNRLSYAYCQK
jgi:hypothetical protein